MWLVRPRIAFCVLLFIPLSFPRSINLSPNETTASAVGEIQNDNRQANLKNDDLSASMMLVVITIVSLLVVVLLVLIAVVLVIIRKRNKRVAPTTCSSPIGQMPTLETEPSNDTIRIDEDRTGSLRSCGSSETNSFGNDPDFFDNPTSDDHKTESGVSMSAESSTSDTGSSKSPQSSTKSSHTFKDSEFLDLEPSEGPAESSSSTPSAYPNHHHNHHKIPTISQITVSKAGESDVNEMCSAPGFPWSIIAVLGGEPMAPSPCGRHSKILQR